MMRLQPRSQQWMTAEQIGDVTVVKLITPSVLDEQVVQAFGRQLFDLADRSERCRLVIDFGPVERVTSTLFGKLIALHKKIQADGGRLVLCSIKPKLFEIFEILRLHSLFSICADEQEALQSF
jgi:anti-sigma B factor antagonist